MICLFFTSGLKWVKVVLWILIRKFFFVKKLIQETGLGNILNLLNMICYNAPNQREEYCFYMKIKKMLLHA